ncbi:glycoside hydrolase family 27 protein [Butyriboletus roseoflavus]|nr:glycoside hydrolase family 27 protein [Butyriboletus roseoflavus]
MTVKQGQILPTSSTPLLAQAQPTRKQSNSKTPAWSAVAFTLVAALGLSTLLYRIKYGHPTSETRRVGKLPVMGYNTWNAYYCAINETLIIKTAKLVQSLGLADAGYDHINIDDCYSEKKRSPAGDIVANQARFPSGMKVLTDQIHELGFKAGIYSDSGWFTCQLYPGSYQNEARDAKLFQDWGFDYLKYDNCAVPFDNITRQNIMGRYERMANAIEDLAESSGKPPLFLSMCQWGREQGWLWAKKYGQSWRTTDDIGASWSSIANLINQNSFYTWATDFYGHNDMDMLEIGNGDLTYDEMKTHFTAWALMKSPLLLGLNLDTASKESLEILTNPEIIAINQDPVVGTSISPFRWGINPNYFYPGLLFALLRQSRSTTLDEPASMFFNLTESPWIRAGRQYSVRDLWTHTDIGTAVRNFTVYDVPAHGVAALLLQDAGDEPEGLWPPCAVIEWCMSEDGTMYDPDKKWSAEEHQEF